ncbi:MAG: YidC/Oxa1 family insertase periplasmic-domain containing protein [Planctomycetota bacterium]|nr:YidC/Oxa1 family insertase periplasmic-domain containing protein [Planctomycetota bacterium]
MNPRVNRRLRLLVPLGVLAAGAIIVAMVVFSPKMGRTPTKVEAQSNATKADLATATTDVETPPDQSQDTTPTDAASTTETPTPGQEDPSAAGTTSTVAEVEETPVEVGPVRSLEGLTVRKQEIPEDESLPVLGGLLDPDNAKMEIIFTRTGAGISSITFSNIWVTAAAKRQANAYFSAQASGSTEGYELPPEDMRFVLQREQTVPYGKYSFNVSLMAASGLSVQWHKGEEVISLEKPLPLLPASSWKPIAPGTFKAEIINDQEELVLEILRRFELGDGFDIKLHQRVVNHSGQALDVQWQQYGPPNLLPDRARYLDRRRFRFGYEFSQDVDPDQFADVIAEGDMLLEYGDIIKSEDVYLWPNDESREEGFTLSWFASTSRYFAMAIHPLLGPDGSGNRSLEPVVQQITRSLYTLNEEVLVETGFFSPLTPIAAGDRQDFSMGLYAGPLSAHILEQEQPYVALNMGGMILYQISGFSVCACCTFQWLADLLLAVLAFLANNVVFDWGMAIIVLVMIVRFLLHPITRMSQVNMQKFSRKMQKLKPELDRLKERCGDDKKKMQQEQMKLMREHGLNPFQMLGCLPMLLQMPIWIALYAGLYFSYSLRQEPAFWGFFQIFDGWPFLADLAAPDHFFYTFQEPHQVLFWHVSGINLLPILLGVFFFLQQKYLTPQNAAMTPEQQTQQKMIRVMTVVAFPLFLYTAPSGLTLYIMTSSIIGTLEGRHIRKQVDRMDLDLEPVRAKASTVAGRAAAAGPKSGRDAQSRAYSRMVERRQSKGKGGKGRGGKKRG